MVGVRASYWQSLETWSPRAFVAAGLLFVGHAVVRGVEAFTAVTPPPDVFGPAGYLVAIVGLFGVYRTLATRMPRVARVAAVGAMIPAIGWGTIVGWGLGEAAGVVAPLPAVVPEAFFIVIVVTTALTYVLFGVASLRTDPQSRTIGLLLLAPPAVLVALITGAVIIGATSTIGPVLIGSGLALAHFAIGGALRSGDAPTDSVAPAVDVTAD